MFSFMKIATFAALAFGTLASAIPAPDPAAEAHELVDRRTAPDVTTVLAELTVSLAVPCIELKNLNAAQATPAIVKPIVEKIKTLIEDATEACGKAPGLGIGDILALLSAIIELVLSTLNHVFNVCKDKAAILEILQILDSVLAALISAILTLLGGTLSTIIGQLVSLLGQVIQIILSLKFTACAKVLLLV